MKQVRDLDIIAKNKPAWLPFPISLDRSEKDQMVSEVQGLSEEYWFDDSYRACTMAMIYTDGGEYRDKRSVHQAKGKAKDWTEVSSLTPTLKSFIQNAIFPQLGSPGRMTLLRTLPGESLNEHFDCSPKEKDSFMPKLRVVLSGPTDSLYFVGENRQKIYAPSECSAYLIDGSRAHGMNNRSSDTKITLCMGAPWDGEISEAGFNNLSAVSGNHDVSRFFRSQLLASGEGVQYQNTGIYES